MSNLKLVFATAQYLKQRQTGEYAEPLKELGIINEQGRVNFFKTAVSFRYWMKKAVLFPSMEGNFRTGNKIIFYLKGPHKGLFNGTSLKFVS